MLLGLRSLLKLPVLGRGEESGCVRDLLLDVRTWSVSRVLAGIDSLFRPRAAVNPTFFVGSIPFDQAYFPVAPDVPDFATPAPLCTLPSGDIFSAYGDCLLGRWIPTPAPRAPAPPNQQSNTADETPLADLRSATDLLTYRVAAIADRDFGSPADFIVDHPNFFDQRIEISRWSGSLHALAAVPPLCFKTLAALQRAIRTYGMRGVFRWSRNSWRAALESPQANCLLSMNRISATPPEEECQ